jgi:HAD superfamily hydrolase (TIGR01509 family)
MFRGILFDWRGTLFHDLSDAEWVRASAAAIGRTLSDADVLAITGAIERAAADPAVVAAVARADISAEAHRAATLLHFRTAGLDDALARAIYERDGMLDASFPYPDAPRVLREVKARGCRIAVLSDIHYDLRPHFRHHGLDGLIDAWAFSYEHGWTKPEPEAFLTALRMLDLSPAEALMVGDRASRDGGAAAAGIVTVLLPPAPAFSPRGLDLVLRIVGTVPGT